MKTNAAPGTQPSTQPSQPQPPHVTPADPRKNDPNLPQRTEQNDPTRISPDTNQPQRNDPTRIDPNPPQPGQPSQPGVPGQPQHPGYPGHPKPSHPSPATEPYAGKTTIGFKRSEE